MHIPIFENRCADLTITAKSRTKFSRLASKTKEGAQRLSKSISNAMDDERERLKELWDKMRASQQEHKKWEHQQAEERKASKAASEREEKVTQISFGLDQFTCMIKQIEEDGFIFNQTTAVNLLKCLRDLKEGVPVMLGCLPDHLVTQYSHLNTDITNISTATAVFVKELKVCT